MVLIALILVRIHMITYALGRFYQLIIKMIRTPGGRWGGSREQVNASHASQPCAMQAGA